MAIVVTGASGLLGRALMREFSEDAIGWAFSRANAPLIKVGVL